MVASVVLLFVLFGVVLGIDHGDSLGCELASDMRLSEELLSFEEKS